MLEVGSRTRRARPQAHSHVIHGHVRHYVGNVVCIQGRSGSGRAIWVSQNIIYYSSAVACVWVCLEAHFGVPCRTPEVNLHNRKHDVATERDQRPPVRIPDFHEAAK